jgi:hypothetical protein
VEGVSGHVERFDLLFGDFDAIFVDGRIESGVDGQAGSGRRGTDILRCSLKERRGLALRLTEIGANILCSIGFHLLVPGG